MTADPVKASADKPIKLSAVVCQFAEPFLKGAKTRAEIENILLLCVLAWNVSLYPEEQRPATMEGLLAHLPSQPRHDFRLKLREMIEHKDRSFSDYRRAIASCKVSFEDGYPVVTVKHAETE